MQQLQRSLLSCHSLLAPTDFLAEKFQYVFFTFLPAQSLSHTPSYPEQRKQISVNRKKNSNIHYKETTAQTNDVKKTEA